MTHPDLPAEVAFVHHAYRRLEIMRDLARLRMEEVLDLGRGGTHQSRAERDVVVRSSLARLDALEVGGQSLVFGRIDFDEKSPTYGGSSFHIGRLSVNGEDMEPLVVDWRAPVSEAFYRATGKDPMGLRMRRHLLCKGERVVDLEDELLGFDEAREDSDDFAEAPISGAGALFAAVSRPRTPYMADIVATIQGEQDTIVRHPLAGVLVVQGAPGTGKTAVALHRAAYLLYTHRWRFERQGLLVVGPSSDFVRYIGHVLPSLGESGVELRTVEGVTPYIASAVETNPKAIAIKGSQKMVRLLSKGVADRQRPLRKVAEISFGSKVLRVPPELTSQIVSSAKRRSGPHNSRRRLVESKLAEILAKAYLEGGPLVRQRDPESNVIPISSRAEELAATPLPGEDEDVQREVMGTLRHSVEFQRVVERIWPKLSAQEFLHDLFSHRPLLELAGRGILSAEEIDVLHIVNSPDSEAHKWTREDLMLLDEARVLLEGDGDDDVTYGHVVIDEAQDLSPMAARMLNRRCPQGSLTVLGDLAQAVGPWASRGWEEITAPLRNGREMTLVELTVNYRTPEEISEVADIVRSQYLPNYPQSRSIRRTGRKLRYFSAERGRLLDAVRETVGQRLLSLVGGTCGVVAPLALLDDIAAVFESGSDLGEDDLLRRVSFHDVGSVRGLEFDMVVIVEPLELLPEKQMATRALFVALTRATQEVVMVGSSSLPDWLQVRVIT